MSNETGISVILDPRKGLLITFSGLAPGAGTLNSSRFHPLRPSGSGSYLFDGQPGRLRFGRDTEREDRFGCIWF